MKRFLIILVFVFLMSTAYAIDWGKQQDIRREMEKQLFHDFCEGVNEGGKCKVPYLWSEKFWGVCCDKTCNGFTTKCGKPGFGGTSLLDVIVTMPCMNRRQGDECDLPQDIIRKYPNAPGVCCDGQCVYSEEQCDSGYGSYGGVDDGPPSPEEFEKILELLTSISCVGMGDGEPCQMPDDPNSPMKELNLFGVCCSGKCRWRSTECPPKVDEKKPDLVIVGMDIHPENPGVNTPIENATITIKNQGNAKTTDYFWVEFMKEDDSPPINRQIKKYLNAGEDITLSFQEIPPYQRPGKYTLTAVVDSSLNSLRNNLIDESDEDNNKVTWEIFVEKTPAKETLTRDEGNKKEERPDNPGGDFPVSLLPVVVILLVLVAGLLYSLRSRKQGVDYELQIKKLLGEKKTIEEMIELAKVKYHKRKLDEESFREIVRDNQKRLIEVETKIRDMGGRMKKLERRK